MIFDADGVAMVPVHECWSDAEAQIVISCLRAHGIEAVANSEIPHEVLPIYVNGLGKLQVLVRAGDVQEAIYILRTREEWSENFDDPHA
jgi:hypothetical protein